MNEGTTTKRLYFDDPERTRFRARVLERLPVADGSLALVLDQTCFYPSSGGQPHDTGHIGGVPVFDVREDDAGRVVHYLRGDPGGDEVDGEVDWQRRHDHMQQHSGQHLLSAACLALLQRDTESFHLGSGRCSIDLPGAPIAAAVRREVERRANAVVWEGRAVHVRMLGAAEVPALRKLPPAGLERLRIVEIDGWDRSPCCGTHVRRTHEIGFIKLLGQERVRDSARLYFLCGDRALAEVARGFELQEELVRAMSCHPEALPARIQALGDESKRLHKELAAARRELASGRAEAWIATAAPFAGRPLVVRALEVGAAATLPTLAAALVERGAIALLGVAAARVQLLFAAPEAAGIDLRPVLHAACGPVEGRGGGVASRVQGTGPRSSGLAAALEAAEAALRAQERPAAL